MSIREKILEYINSKDYKPLLKEELLVKFGLDKSHKETFYNILNSLEREGLIIKAKNDKYGSINSDYLIVGHLEGHDRGFGFVIGEDKDRADVFIPAENMNGAMHGDKVIANIIKKSEAGKSEEGTIIRILERKNKSIVGTFEKSKNFGFVVPDNQKIYYDIFIPKSEMLKAKNNQKVVVEITKWPRPRRNPEGRIVEVLGYLDEKGTDILSIIKQYQFPMEFSKEVKDYVGKIDNKISDCDIKNRVDLRELKTFTIDGADAKDLDDAISIEKTEDGDFRLGVHIADVSHYVKENSELDMEAFERGNSVYLLDRVIPMLPKELSNGICSLNPNEDRLTLSVIMDIDQGGNVKKHQIVESVIRSKARLVYDDVSDYLENPENELDSSIENLLEEIDLMKELTEILRSRRQRRGSIDFDIPESHIELDEDGMVKDVRKADRRIANRMIEEFMLITNETVSEEYYWTEIPFLYRVHEEPEDEKLRSFASFLHNLGYTIKGKEIYPKDLQTVLEEIRGKKEESIVSILLLRSLKKARYSHLPDIHFGLAAKYYSHFTAPIRRYSDLTIHRIIKANIKGNLDSNKRESLEEKLADIADYTSKTERRAEDAEREVEDLKKAQFMYSKVGEEYTGIVSSLTNFGIFIQLDNTIEGLVHFNNMIDDYYFFDEENYVIEGERSKKQYRIGDEVKILVDKVDIMKRTIDFQIIE